MFLFFFFFSSRRRHTRYWRDWSSDVCSSDLLPPIFWSEFPEDILAFSGATRGNGVGARACSIIFGTFHHRSSVIFPEPRPMGQAAVTVCCSALISGVVAAFMTFRFIVTFYGLTSAGKYSGPGCTPSP